MGRSNPLSAEVNFIISVVFIGSAALLGIVSILEISDNDNPIANILTATVVSDGSY